MSHSKCGYRARLTGYGSPCDEKIFSIQYCLCGNDMRTKSSRNIALSGISHLPFAFLSAEENILCLLVG